MNHLNLKQYGFLPHSVHYNRVYWCSRMLNTLPENITEILIFVGLFLIQNKFWFNSFKSFFLSRFSSGFLCCTPLETNTRRKCLFDTFLQSTKNHNISSLNVLLYVHLCNAITEYRSNFIVKFQEIMSDATL